MWDFISNNLVILTTIIIAIISGCFNVYQHIANKKLKKFATEKDLKRRKASLEKLQNNYKLKKKYNLGISILGEDEKEDNEFTCREKELTAEIEYLEKVLKIKN